MSVVNLTVHKNTARKRRAKRLRDDIVLSANDFREKWGDRFDGYAVIGWTNDGEANAYWNHGELGPHFIENHASTILRRKIRMKDTKTMYGDDDAG